PSEYARTVLSDCYGTKHQAPGKGFFFYPLCFCKTNTLASFSENKGIVDGLAILPAGEDGFLCI
ncbi:MAG: hypothetical protein IJ175_03195, partial [Clostridia bacterium]|nr:hypothetical protein [Clostridia bacterium]